MIGIIVLTVVYVTHPLQRAKLSQLFKKAADDPTKIRQNPIHIASRISDSVKQDIGPRVDKFRYRNLPRIDIKDSDWDNIILIDACRWDLFNQNAVGLDSDTEAQPAISVGTGTTEYLEKTYADDIWHDTVYVSANPQIERHGYISQFHKVIKVWETGWDEDLQTVPPEPVSKKALSAYNNYPNKRIIVHYLQPHMPFIGETGEDIRHGGTVPIGAEERDAPKIWTLLKRGEIDKQLAWKAYSENLDIVLPEVQKLLNAFNGKTIFTSDHGNAFGEWGTFGHPSNHPIYPLCVVPYLEQTQNGRKDTYSEPPEDSLQADQEEVKSKLRALGYVDKSLK